MNGRKPTRPGKPSKYATDRRDKIPALIFPMRINKYVALKEGINRREADALVKDGKIFVNGKVAIVGEKIIETDKIVYTYRGNYIERLSGGPRKGR
jgi:hypothetical protein